MKLREGFVSNSSTASFIVKYKEMFRDNNVPLLTLKEIKILEKIGFHKTLASYPEQISDREEVKDDEKFYNYGFFIIVNEKEIIDDLITYNIPFVANCHYDQYTVIYEKNSKYVDVFINAGMHLQMGLATIEQLTKKPCAKRITIKKFLKEGYYIWK